MPKGIIDGINYLIKKFFKNLFRFSKITKIKIPNYFNLIKRRKGVHKTHWYSSDLPNNCAYKIKNINALDIDEDKAHPT